MGPSHAPDSFAPDRYTSFQADAGEFRAEPYEDDPKYVASGLYLDSEDGPYRAAPDAVPGGWEDPGTPEPAPGRAGRNLPAAIGVGVGLGAAVIASLFLWRPAFLGVVAAAIGIGIWEVVRAIRSTGANPPLVPLVAGGALMTGLAWWGEGDALTFGLVVTVVAVMVWRLADGSWGTAGMSPRRRSWPSMYHFWAASRLCWAARTTAPAGWWRRWPRWCSPTPAATSRACCSGGTRWPRPSAQEVVGGPGRVAGRDRGGQRRPAAAPAGRFGVVGPGVRTGRLGGLGRR